MKILEKYEGNKTYMFPNNALATPATIEAQFPAITSFVHIIETDEAGEVCFAVMNLSAMRSMHEIDKSLTEAEAIVALQDLINTSPIVDTEPSTEEIAAASMDFDNYINL